MTQPSLQRNAATRDITFENVEDEVILRLQNSPIDPFAVGVWIVQAAYPFTIEVMGPLGIFGPYPQTATGGIQGGGAGDIVVVRGRWEQIRVSITSPAADVIAVASDGDVLPQAVINVDDTTGFAAAGVIKVTTVADGVQYLTYTGKTGTTFTGVTGGTGELTTGDAIVQVGNVAFRGDTFVDGYQA